MYARPILSSFLNRAQWISSCVHGVLISVEICDRTEEANLANYVKMSTESLVQGVMVANIVNCEDSKEKHAFKIKIQNEYAARWTENKMCGKFIREIPENIDRERTWEWMRKSGLKVEIEALICVAQEQR